MPPHLRARLRWWRSSTPVRASRAPCRATGCSFATWACARRRVAAAVARLRAVKNAPRSAHDALSARLRVSLRPASIESPEPCGIRDRHLQEARIAATFPVVEVCADPPCAPAYHRGVRRASRSTTVSGTASGLGTGRQRDLGREHLGGDVRHIGRTPASARRSAFSASVSCHSGGEHRRQRRGDHAFAVGPSFAAQRMRARRVTMARKYRLLLRGTRSWNHPDAAESPVADSPAGALPHEDRDRDARPCEQAARTCRGCRAAARSAPCRRAQLSESAFTYDALFATLLPINEVSMRVLRSPRRSSLMSARRGPGP